MNQPPPEITEVTEDPPDPPPPPEGVTMTVRTAVAIFPAVSETV